VILICNILCVGYAYFLPEDVNYDTKVDSQTKKRGIYNVAVYSLSTSVKGKFLKPDANALGIAPNNLKLNQAFVVVGLSDTRGIKEQVELNWGGKSVSFLPGTNGVLYPQTYDVSPNYDDDFGMSEGVYRATSAPIKYDGNQSVVGIYAPVTIGNANEIEFSFDLSLLGTNKLHFYPLGKTTQSKLSSSWTNPSFDGNILPEESDNDNNLNNGFVSTWKTSYFSRGVAQSFVGNQDQIAQQLGQIQSKKFGLTFKIPVDFYQKTERSVKYGVLFIGLTFLVYFCFEALDVRRKKIHPFQYILIGVSMSVFYLLLLSLSEYLGFNMAYFISSISTIALVTWYSSTVLSERKSVTWIALLLAVIYVYLFTLLQLEDYALLIGSLATFATLFIVMYVTRKINWYNLEQQ
jgi:inner membrane protein